MPLDLSKYLSLFVSETQERLQALSQDLVRLEAAKAAGEPRGPIVDGIFRAMHSVKGMAASMELDAISRVAHRAEDLADVMRRTPEAVAPRGIDVLLATVDALGVMVAAAAAGQKAEVPQPLLDRLVEARAEAQALALLTAGLAPSAEPPRAEAVAPAGPPPEEAPLEPARGKERRRYKVTVEVSGLCPVPAVRGFLVHKRLCGLGAVLACAPTVEDLRAGRLPGNRLELVVDSAEPADAVRDTLARVSDLTGVAVEDAGPAPVSWPAMAPAPLAPEPPREPAPGTPEGPRTVRVKTELLDYFLDAVGELILATARLREVGKALPEGNRPALDDGVDRLHAIVKDLHDKVMAVRMTPLALVTDRLPRAARDLARRVGKQVEVDVRGAEIELDRAILEELGDPLLHVLRNCVDHGIEEAHLRQLAGKPAAGRVSVAARRERDRVLLEIADDGRGMDPEKLRAAAVRRGAVTPEQAAALTDREALLLSCLPGVSTAESVTDVSGRGVGMDVVKRAVELVGGALEIDSVPGQGTRFTFRLPLTVAVQPVLLVRVGEEVLALPIAKVVGAVELAPEKLTSSRGAPLLPYDDALIPVHDLGELLGIPRDAVRLSRPIVVVEGEGGRMALGVDALIGQEEAVLKPLSRPLDLVPGLSAVTVLGNGRPVFVLDIPRLLAA